MRHFVSVLKKATRSKTATVILFSILITLSVAQKKDKSDKDKSNNKNSDEEESELPQSYKYGLDSSRNRNRNRDDNYCSCRGLQDQVETLDMRLDRMIGLWNDFVDRNQDPYEGGNRQPPRGSQPPYRSPQRPGSGRMPPAMNRPGRYIYDDPREDYDQNAGPRRFRF